MCFPECLILHQWKINCNQEFRKKSWRVRIYATHLARWGRLCPADRVVQPWDTSPWGSCSDDPHWVPCESAPNNRPSIPLPERAVRSTYHHQVGDQALGLQVSLLRIGPWGSIPQSPVPLGEKLSIPGAAEKPAMELENALCCHIWHQVPFMGTRLEMTCGQQTTVTEILPSSNPVCL